MEDHNTGNCWAATVTEANFAFVSPGRARSEGYTAVALLLFYLKLRRSPYMPLHPPKAVTGLQS